MVFIHAYIIQLATHSVHNKVHDKHTQYPTSTHTNNSNTCIIPSLCMYASLLATYCASLTCTRAIACAYASYAACAWCGGGWWGITRAISVCMMLLVDCGACMGERVLGSGCTSCVGVWIRVCMDVHVYNHTPQLTQQHTSHSCGTSNTSAATGPGL